MVEFCEGAKNTCTCTKEVALVAETACEWRGSLTPFEPPNPFLYYFQVICRKKQVSSCKGVKGSALPLLVEVHGILRTRALERFRRRKKMHKKVLCIIE